MAIVLTSGREVMRIICAYGPQSRRPDTEKLRFYDKMASEWHFGSFSEIIVSLGDFNGHKGKCVESFEGAHGGRVLGKEMLKEEDRWSSVMKESCAWQTLGFMRQTKRKLLIVPVDVKQKLICACGRKIQKVYKRCKCDSMVTSDRLVIVDLDIKVLKKVVKKQRIITRKIWKLNENRTRVRFEKSVKQLVSTSAPDLLKSFKDGVLKACDEVCGKKKSRRD